MELEFKVFGNHVSMLPDTPFIYRDMSIQT